MSALRRLASRLFRTDAPAPPAPETRAVVRRDAYGPMGSMWSNSATGIGIDGIDPSLESTFRRGWITDEQAIAMWQGDELITKLVSTLPSEAIEPGWKIHIQSDEQGASGAADPRDPVELAEQVETDHETLKTEKLILKACNMERLTGGAALWLGANDMVAGSWEHPLDLTTGMLRINWLRVLRSRELYPHRRYEDPLHPKFGEIEVWRVQPMAQGRSSGAAYVHESRLFIFEGKRIDDTGATATQNGHTEVFGDGIIPGLLDAVRRLQMSLSEAGLTLSANAEGVWTHENLAEVLALEGGNEDFQNLVRAMNFAQSVLKSRIIGGGQTFERKGVPLAGVADLIEKFENQLAGISGTPRTKLFGEAPGGLGAGDEAGQKNWNRALGAYRKERQTPAYRWVTRHILVARGGEPKKWTIEGNRYEQHSDMEQATLTSTEAQTDIALVQAQIITPDVVRKRQIWRDRYPLEDENELPPMDLLGAPDDLRLPPGQPVELVEQVQDAAPSSLTPAQIVSLSSLCEKVASGRLLREDAIKIAQIGFGTDVAARLFPAESRADCDNPVRQEGGMFDGCQPGDGGGSSRGSSSESGGGSSPAAKTTRALSPRFKKPATLDTSKTIMGSVTFADASHMYEPPEGYTAEFDGFAEAKNNGKGSDFGGVSMNVKDASGATIATVERYFSNGGKTAEHHSLVIDPSHQGKGLSDAINRRSFEEYEKAGVENVKLNANWVGRYKWATLGFSPSPGDVASMRANFPKQMDSWGVGGDAQKAVLDNADRPWRLAKIDDGKTYEVSYKSGKDGARQTGRFHLGKAILLSDAMHAWKGNIKVDRNDEGYQVAMKKLKIGDGS